MMMMSGMSFEKKRHHRHATLDFEPKCLEHTPTLFVLRNFITIAIEKRKERNNDPERQAYGSKHHESEFRAKTDEKKIENYRSRFRRFYTIRTNRRK